MENIQDYSKYTSLMRNGFYDKLFFVDKLFGEWKTMLDYGCADGFITKLIAEVFPDKYITGYDEDALMLLKARVSGSNPVNASFNSPIGPYDILNLGSVIHEVYSYKNQSQINDFWDFVFNSGFKRIIIRDMLFDTRHEERIDYKPVLAWCEKNDFGGELKRFEELHGDIGTYKSIVHFLLKYLYLPHPNWARELRESYLACSYQDLLSKVPLGYKIVYSENYCLPYLHHRWFEDFGIRTQVKTHAKLILQYGD